MSSNTRSTFQCGNYWLKLSILPLYTGHSVAGDLMPRPFQVLLTSHLLNSPFLPLASDSISQYYVSGGQQLLKCVRRASGASGMTLRKAPTGPVSSHLNHRIPLPSLHHMGLYQQVCIERRNVAHFVTRRL